MGVSTRRPLLPAPTESSIVDTSGGSVTGTDLGTDLSRRTDKTSYSIPDDGSPVIIPTRRKHRSRGEDTKLSRSAHHSQTSLLIEYFEGGKGSGGTSIVSRPSVRVRVTPSSSAKKSKEPSVHITDSAGNRKPSYSRRISLGSPSKQKSGGEAAGDDLSYTSSADENQNSGPVEIELMNRDQGSELSTRRYLPASDISSMPADSMLEAPSSGPAPRRKRSQSLERALEEPEPEADPKDFLKTPSRQRSRSLSTERIAQRAAEKVSNYSRDASNKRRSDKNRGIAADYQERESKPSRRRSKNKEDDMASPESSLLSASGVSSNRRSGGPYDFRANTSKSSLNNPKLLETVEDAIRRLILPELKELKKDQKVITNTSKFERDLSNSYSPASSESREGGLMRRLSKHASAPNVRKPKVVLNRDSRDEGIVLADDSVSSQKGRRASRDSEMTSDTSYIKGLQPEPSDQDMVRRHRSKGLRDAEKAGIVGSRLTANNLKHHDSRSSIDKYESQKDNEPKNINETELVFQKHNVAPMPFRSALESDLMTRDSILSDQTVEPEHRGSRNDLGLKHSNMSSHNISVHSISDQGREWSHSPSIEGAAGTIAAAAAANLLDTHSDHRELGYGDNLNARRALSPIQSVASNQSESHVRQDSTQHVPQEYSGDERDMEPRLSIESLSSAPSTSLARSQRPAGFTESQEEIYRNQKGTSVELGYEGSSVRSPQSPRERHWQEESDEEGDDYRHSLAETASIEPQNMANYTDGSESDFIEKANQGRPVGEGVAVNPKFIHPTAVESAVASVLDPSILDTKSNQSGASQSRSNTYVQNDSGSTRSLGQLNDPAQTSRQGSPLKQRMDASSPDATSFPRRMGATSPPQSVTQSLDDLNDPVKLHPDQHVESSSPLPEDRDLSPEAESEINTNPSIIQGPIGGVPQDSSWPYEPTNRGQSPLFDGSSPVAAAAGAGLAYASAREADYDPDYYPEDDYGADAYQDQQYANGGVFSTPPGAKDEGYVSAANPISPSPEPGTKGFGGIDTNGLGLFDSPPGADDSFGPSHQRHFSGYSHGVGSPLYDSATGRGIERIQSKDIVALMDHLTVRDAQRNARDTEILVTLVRSAAEMRNSFEEMKKFISQQDGMLQDANERQHERTYKAIGGPRPLPINGNRSARQTSMDDGEAKRKNVFKRALKGLSLKSGNDLTRIEEMLEQLLDEMDSLRTSQTDMLRSGNRGPASVDLDGYEPEGHAGTSSPGDHSGFLSNSSRAAAEPRGTQRSINTRVSTVPEADEDEEADERGDFLSPQLPLQETTDTQRERAGSAPLSTPPRAAVASGGLSHSNETTPKTNEKSRKHKSSSSSFFPKISRWSRTTASSMGDNIRNSMQPGRKERVSFDTSRSGSDLEHNVYKSPNYYDPQGDDRIRSNYTLDEGSPQQENRPPSPLVPSQVSEAPKYRAHRGSLDLQHPQPRQGPTGRYQTQLESQAQIYGTSGNHSDQWGSNPSFSALNGNRRSSGGSRPSPISDAGYSETSGRSSRQGPPRPPKLKDDGPLFPERPPKIKEGEEQSYADRVASRSSAMQSPHNTPPTRKPTGPRPLNSNSQYNSPNRRRRNYRDSPEQVDDEHDY